MMSEMEMCPCGSGAVYESCCSPLVSGARTAGTAEELMRSRYSAYTKVEMDYLFETTHPDHRKGYDHEGTKTWAEEAEWDGLEIVSTRLGGPEDGIGEVEFVARWKENGMKREHHEVGGFRKKEGKWYFTEGKMVKPQPIVVNKVGRNDPCTCGSGAKYKKCCGK
jgi:SEC-C motif domain protein